MKIPYIIAIAALLMIAGSAFALFTEDRPIIAIVVGLAVIAGLALVAALAARGSQRRTEE
jgi:hypothetical protein